MPVYDPDTHMDFPHGFPTVNRGKVPCSALLGPCHCGAWHTPDDWCISSSPEQPEEDFRLDPWLICLLNRSLVEIFASYDLELDGLFIYEKSIIPLCFRFWAKNVGQLIDRPLPRGPDLSISIDTPPSVETRIRLAYAEAVAAIRDLTDNFLEDA